MAKLNHVGIYVRNLDKSIQFYKELFGFEIVREFTSGEAKIAMLDLGDGMLELVQRPGSPGNPPEGNWSHLALRDPDFDTTVTKLESKNVSTKIIEMDSGAKLCFFSDPDGHVIEIMSEGF